MSQVLALIVAASVLMMTALTVIIMVQGGLGGLGDTVNNQGCISAVNAQCSAQGNTGDVNIPSSCKTDDGEVVQALQNSDYGAAEDDDQVDCITEDS